MQVKKVVKKEEDSWVKVKGEILIIFRLQSPPPPLILWTDFGVLFKVFASLELLVKCMELQNNRLANVLKAVTIYYINWKGSYFREWCIWMVGIRSECVNFAIDFIEFIGFFQLFWVLFNYKTNNFKNWTINKKLRRTFRYHFDHSWNSAVMVDDEQNMNPV